MIVRPCNKLLQQIWRIHLHSFASKVHHDTVSNLLGTKPIAAKQLNRTLYAQNSLTYV
jgi:hypothetical protein